MKCLRRKYGEEQEEDNMRERGEREIAYMRSLTDTNSWPDQGCTNFIPCITIGTGN